MINKVCFYEEVYVPVEEDKGCLVFVSFLKRRQHYSNGVNFKRYSALTDTKLHTVSHKMNWDIPGGGSWFIMKDLI